jgi:hypothetical protein
MKKTMMAIGLVVLAAALYAQVSVAGQTLHYSYVFTVDSETEVRSIYPMGYRLLDNGSDYAKNDYITFTRNACYQSDSNGIQYGRDTYTYQGEQNNMLVFSRFNPTGFKNEYYLYFSKDYKRLNYRAINSNAYIEQDKVDNRLIHVYEQSAPPTPQQQTGPAGPDRMW